MSATLGYARGHEVQRGAAGHSIRVPCWAGHASHQWAAANRPQTALTCAWLAASYQLPRCRAPFPGPQERYAAWRDWVALYRRRLQEQGLPEEERVALQASCFSLPHLFPPCMPSQHTWLYTRQQVRGACLAMPLPLPPAWTCRMQQTLPSSRATTSWWASSPRPRSATTRRCTGGRGFLPGKGFRLRPLLHRWPVLAGGLLP